MKKLNLTTLTLLIIALAGLVMMPNRVLAAVPVPKTDSYTIITYSRNSLGILTGQTMVTTSKGVNLQGENFHISTTVNYSIINGQAYASDSTTINHTTSDNGNWNKTFDTITYERDANGTLIGKGANGYRKVMSFNKEDNTTSLQGGELTFENINGSAEVKEWNFKQANWQGDQGEDFLKGFLKEGKVDFSGLKPSVSPTAAGVLKSYTDNGKTTYSYITIHGVTKTDNIQTIADTWTFADGTLPANLSKLKDGSGIKASPLDGQSYAYAKSSSFTKFAYDAKGNLISTPQNIKVHHDKKGTPDNPKDDETWVTIDDKKVQNVDEIQKYIKDKHAENVSYSVSYTAGVRNDPSQGWVVYTQNSFTFFGPYNGQVLPDWTFQPYNNSPVQGTVKTAADPQVIGKVLFKLYVPESDTRDGVATAEDVKLNIANQVGQPILERERETLWLFVEDANKVKYPVKFESKYRSNDLERADYDPSIKLLEEAKNFNIGDMVDINGDIIDGTGGSMLKAIKINKK